VNGTNDAPAPAGIASPRSRRRLWIVIGLALLLVVQGVIDWRTRPEAFPTISMPKFAGAPDPSGVRYDTVAVVRVVYADGSETAPSPRALTDPLPPTELQYLLGPDAASPPLTAEAAGWLRDRARAVGDGAEPVMLEVAWQRMRVDVRAVAMTPDGPPAVRTVSW